MIFFLKKRNLISGTKQFLLLSAFWFKKNYCFLKRIFLFGFIFLLFCLNDFLNKHFIQFSNYL